MKKGMQRMLAVLVAVLLVLSVGGALAEKRTESSAFRFSGVQRRPEQPDPTQEPVADDEPLDPAQPEQPEAPAEPEKPAHNAVVEVKDKHGNLNIRAAAGEENEWIGALPNGAEITIISIEGNWALIRTDDGLEGYVSLTYLRRTDLPEEPAQEDKQEKPAERKNEEKSVAAVGDADVRLAGDGLSEIIITVTDGTPLKVLGVEGDWIKVEVNGVVGYIFKDSVQGLEVEEPEQAEPKVTIFSSRRAVMVPGEIVYLTSKLENLEGYQISYQWQCDRGAGFQNVPGATGDSYAFTASTETLAYNWRLMIDFN